MAESNTNIGEGEMNGPVSVAKRVLVVANKNWEVAPLLGVLLEKKSCPKALTDPPLGRVEGAKALHRSPPLADRTMVLF